MKRILTLIFLFYTATLFAFQNTVTAPMPPEETKPTSYWWWVLGVILAIAVGMLLYRLIKKDPKKDAV